MSQSKIQWTDATWNPVRGCSRVSAGCEHCYAETMAARFSGPGQPFEGFAERGKSGSAWTGRVELMPRKLSEPLHWQKPRRIFVNSMSDLFHEGLSDEMIAAVFGVMAACPQHVFQVLTKRPERMRYWFQWIHEQSEDLRGSVGEEPPSGFAEPSACAMFYDHDPRNEVFQRSYKQVWPLPNVWLGVSVEDQATADERIPILLDCPAALRFVSYEPALGPVDLSAPHIEWYHRHGAYGEDGSHGIDWLIIGGESGPGARPCDVRWLRGAVEQCQGAGVPVFVKQLGARPRLVANPNDALPQFGEWSGVSCEVDPETGVFALFNHPKGGDPNEWPEDLRVREFPA